MYNTTVDTTVIAIERLNELMREVKESESYKTNPATVKEYVYHESARRAVREIEHIKDLLIYSL